MWHLYDLVISTFESRWTLRLDIDTFRLFVQHPEHKRMLNNMNATILSVLTNLNPQVIAKLRAETLDVKPVILIAISHGFFPFFLFSFVAPWSNSNTNRRKHTEV